MKNTSTIGMSFLEKLIAVLSPVVLGVIGWILPKLLGLVTKIPVLSDSMIIRLLDSFNALWLSVILMIIGVVIGILVALAVYSEALKMSIKEQEIQIDRYDKKSIIKKSEAKNIFMEDHTVVITGNKGQELLREK